MSELWVYFAEVHRWVIYGYNEATAQWQAEFVYDDALMAKRKLARLREGEEGEKGMGTAFDRYRLGTEGYGTYTCAKYDDTAL